MIQPGGVKDITDLKFLILYVLSYCEAPVSYSVLSEIIMADGLADFFGFSEALSQLTQSGHVLSVPVKDGESELSCTNSGYEAISLFQKKLPYSVRRQAVSSARAVLQRQYTDTIVRADYFKQSDTSYPVTLAVRETGSSENLHVTIDAPSEESAKLICDNFKKHTGRIYSAIADLLTRRWDSEENSNG